MTASRPTPLRNPVAPEITFAQIRDGYLKTIGNGAVENNTLYTSKIHLAHLAGTLGERFPIASLAHADLQRHVTRRSASDSVAAITIKKELDTLRSAWNWAKRMGYVQDDFPGAGLVYPKGEEKLPFMTWTEIERRIAAGGDPKELWECLFLREPEIDKFLDFVQQRKAPRVGLPDVRHGSPHRGEAFGDAPGRAAGRGLRGGYHHHPRKEARAGKGDDPARADQFKAEGSPRGAPGRQWPGCSASCPCRRSRRDSCG